MRSCCIENCKSNVTTPGRSLFEINNGRKEWLDLIKRHQFLCENKSLFICDLHFDSNDLHRSGSKTTVRKSALPCINHEIELGHLSLEDQVDITSKSQTLFKEINQNLDDLEDQENMFESQPKTITLKEYTALMQLNIEVMKCKDIIDRMDKEIKTKDEQIKHLKNKLDQGKCVNVSHLSEEQRDVIDCLVNGYRKNSNKYPESVRQFCMRQQYYSFAAYQSLREFFNRNLPSKRTFQKWYSSIDASPGICDSAFDVIRERAESYLLENRYPLHLCLISDEMSMRKQISWCAETQTFIGFSTITSSSKQNIDQNQSNPLKVAKDALVFMITGPDFKIAVAYHLLNGLDCIDRAALTLEVVKKTENTGARLISLTGDGIITNITTAEILGAKFNEDKPYFYSPTYPQQKIYIILDPPHMLKLVRKHFCLDKIYHDNQLVDWNLIRILVEKQTTDNFSLCNKLTKQHINWHQNPMNVKLAAQTISKSVADALQQLCEDGFDDFKNSETTVGFLRRFDEGFDILNVCEKRQTDHGPKQALSASSANYIFSFGDAFKQYIKHLEVRLNTKSNPILESSAGRGFFGFYHTFTSLRGIYDDFILNGPLEKFYTFQFSQDHLETFFSLIRNSLGRNDNPNAVEFRSAFRKLLVCHPITTSVGNNVITNATGILTVSSGIRKKILSTFLDRSQEVEMEISYEELMLNELEAMNAYDQHMAAYIALCIEEKFLQKIERNRYKCSECGNHVLHASNEKINDGLLAMKPGGKQPSESTLKIVIFANAVMKIVSLHRGQGNNFDIVWKTIFNNIDIDDLFPFVEFEQHERIISNELSHEEEFIIEIIKTYMTLKSQKICNKITDEERGELIRHKKKDDIHKAGQ